MDIRATGSVIKLGQSQDRFILQDNLCFICLQSVPLNISNSSLLNFIFNYDFDERVPVCEKCAESITRLKNLFNVLEKVELEIDYLLGLIQKTILNSNKNGRNTIGLNPCRESFAEKCGEKMKCRKLKVIVEDVGVKNTKMPSKTSSYGDLKPLRSSFVGMRNSHRKCGEQALNSFPKVILEKLDISNLISKQSKTSFPDDFEDLSPNLDEDADGSNSYFHSQNPVHPVVNIEQPIIKKELNCDGLSVPDIIPERNSSAAPVLIEVQSIKMEMDGENSVRNGNQEWKPSTYKAGKKCNKCYKIFHNASNFKKHYDAVHLRLKPFKCLTCDRSFGLRRNLQRHIDAVHFNRNNYKCEIGLGDDASFLNSKTSERHNKAKHHKLEKIKPYKCEKCDKSFPSIRSLKRHHKIQSNCHIKISKTFHCEICGKTFDQFQALKWHKRDVHPEEMFPCEICMKMFKRKSDLKGHVLSVHEKRKEYCKVPGCHKGYSRPSYLAQHYRLHHKMEGINTQSSNGNSDNIKVDTIFKEIRMINGDER